MHITEHGMGILVRPLMLMFLKLVKVHINNSPSYVPSMLMWSRFT